MVKLLLHLLLKVQDEETKLMPGIKLMTVLIAQQSYLELVDKKRLMLQLIHKTLMFEIYIG